MKKEYVKLTPDGLNLVTVLDYNKLIESNNFFSGKEIFCSGKFSGDVSILFQLVSRLGAFAKNTNLNKEILGVVISNKIINDFYRGTVNSFIRDLEVKLNQNNSPYRRLYFISENQLIWYLENIAKTTNNEQLNWLIKIYKENTSEPFR